MPAVTYAKAKAQHEKTWLFDGQQAKSSGRQGMARLYARKEDRKSQGMASRQHVTGLGKALLMAKPLRQRYWQVACHRARQGIAHGKAIKAKASGRQGKARLYARKSQGMASRQHVTGLGKALLTAKPLRQRHGKPCQWHVTGLWARHCSRQSH